MKKLCEGDRLKQAMICYFGDTPPPLAFIEAFIAGWMAKKIEVKCLKLLKLRAAVKEEIPMGSNGVN